MRPVRIKDRLKKIEKTINIHRSNEHLVTFVESEDGETVKVSSMLMGGKHQELHIRTVKEAKEFFSSGTFNQIFIMDVPYDEGDPGHAVAGSAYDCICELQQ